jgi:hypothetical protein
MSLLTELEKFWRMIFYKYAAPTVLKGKLFAISPPIGLYYHFLPTCKRQTLAQIEKWPHGLIFARTDGKSPRTERQIVRTDRKTRARTAKSPARSQKRPHAAANAPHGPKNRSWEAKNGRTD